MKSAVAQVGSAKEEKAGRVGRDGQKPSSRSGDLKPRGSSCICGMEGQRTTRPGESHGHKGNRKRSLLSLVV